MVALKKKANNDRCGTNHVSWWDSDLSGPPHTKESLVCPNCFSEHPSGEAYGVLPLKVAPVFAQGFRQSTLNVAPVAPVLSFYKLLQHRPRKILIPSFIKVVEVRGGELCSMSNILRLEDIQRFIQKAWKGAKVEMHSSSKSSCFTTWLPLLWRAPQKWIDYVQILNHLEFLTQNQGHKINNGHFPHIFEHY